MDVNQPNNVSFDDAAADMSEASRNKSDVTNLDVSQLQEDQEYIEKVSDFFSSCFHHG